MTTIPNTPTAESVRADYLAPHRSESAVSDTMFICGSTDTPQVSVYPDGRVFLRVDSGRARLVVSMSLDQLRGMNSQATLALLPEMTL